MGKVIAVISMSVDGMITAANVRLEEPMGDGGLRLHEWMEDTHDSRNREILVRGASSLGAVITGRRNYEHSIAWWGADGPTGSARIPVFVISHNVPQDVPDGGVYTFVDGIEAALTAAIAAAQDKDVSVMGGADIIQQFIRAGLLDGIQLHLVPVLLGSGTRLFEHIGLKHIQLETAEVIETAAAIHLRFRIIK